MATKVFTFLHDPALAASHPLVDAWRTNWKRAGWEPVVLTQGYATTNPRFRSVAPVFATFPTVNPKQYEMACFVRWLAFQMAAKEVGGPVLAVDWDVGCVDYSDAMLHADFSSLRCTLLDADAVPCAVIGTAHGFDRLLDALVDPRYTRPVEVGGRPHVSDMTVVQKARGQFLAAVRCNRHDVDNRLPLVHVPTDSIPEAARPHKHVEFSRILSERIASRDFRRRYDEPAG